jgi:hypothetical protein
MADRTPPSTDSCERYARISELIGHPAGPGFMSETDAYIGDVLRWGEARLQISAPPRRLGHVPSA